MGKTPLKAALCLGLAVSAWSCAREATGPSKYGVEQCRRVALVNSATGEIVRGAEDLALDRERGRLFVSAYDRRAVEKAAKRRQEVLPQGGVYAIALDTLFNKKVNELRVVSLAAPTDFAGGLHPHGIDYDEVNEEVVFVNRTYERTGKKWRMIPRLQRVGANGEVFVGAAAPAHCAANDLTATATGLLSSFDHASCGFGGALENVFRLKRSGVANEAGPVFSKAAFANGIAEMPSGDIAVAATRESAILLLHSTEGGLAERSRIKVSGRPDNLSVSEDGGIVAALHPSMMKLAAARKMGFGKSSSRIVKANAQTGDVSVLFDDVDASLFSAATVAVETPNGLVAGSVIDDGLLVCQAGE